MPTMSPSFRRLAVAGAAVLVLAGAAVGVAAAQAQPSTTPSSEQTAYQKLINSLAQRLNISPQTLQDDISKARTDAGLPAGAGFPGGGHGPRGGFDLGLELNTAATAIGITPQELRTELQTKSLADVATAHGKQPADVAKALKDAANARIDQASTNRNLRPDQVNQMKTQVDQRIDQLMTQVLPKGGPGRGEFGFGDGASSARASTRRRRRSASRRSSCGRSCSRASRWLTSPRHTARPRLMWPRR